MHKVLLNVPNTILEPLMGCDISLDQARIVATLIAHQRIRQYIFRIFPAVIDKTVISTLKSSSDHWDNVLGELVSMRAAGHHTAGDLADLDMFAQGPKQFTLSQISMILNSIVHLNPSRTRDDFVASVRIGDVILRCQKLSIMELASIIAHFMALTRTHPLDAIYKLRALGFLPTELRDGKIFFPYLHDDAVLLDLFDLFNSFSSLIQNLASHSMHPKACGAFAIHFLIRLNQASPVMYRRIMGQLSYREDREWAGEVSEGLMRGAACVILNSQGILDGFYGRLSDVQIQRYDQSLDPKAVDLDRPMVHAIYDAKSWMVGRSDDLGNVWLAIHAQTANRRQQLPIPMEYIQWVDHPISEMIALRRLSSHYFMRKAEPAFINLCLHSTSFEVLLPALTHHLEWLRRFSGDCHVPDIPSNGMSWNGMLNVLSNALRVLLGSGLEPNQVLSFWRLVHPLCDTRWVELPDSWCLTFLQCFFYPIPQGSDMLAAASAWSVVDIFSKVSLWDGVDCFINSHSLFNEPLSLKPQYLGIKWLENVWDVLPRPRSRTAEIRPIAFPWLGVEGGEWDHSNEVVQYRMRERAEEKATEQVKVRLQELDQSVTKVLQTLAKLVEAARLHGLVTVDLADAISHSLLLADEQLQQDQMSLDCIKAIIDPLLIPLPSTPPPRVISFSCHMELPW
jgi:hypothetical protein